MVHPKNLHTILTIQTLWNDEIIRASPAPDSLIRHLEAAASEDHSPRIERMMINFVARLDNIKIKDGGRLRARHKVDDTHVEAISLQIITDQDQADRE